MTGPKYTFMLFMFDTTRKKITNGFFLHVVPLGIGVLFIYQGAWWVMPIMVGVVVLLWLKMYQTYKGKNRGLFPHEVKDNG